MNYHNITKDDMLNGDGLRVVLWEGMNCCEKSTPREERCYPFSEEGLAEASSWVRQEIEESRRQMEEEEY